MRLDQAWQESLTRKTERPEGSFTMREYAAKNGLTCSGAKCRLQKMVKLGKITVAVPTRGDQPNYYVLAK